MKTATSAASSIKWRDWIRYPANEAGVAALLYLLLTLLVLGPALFGPGDVVLSREGTDLAQQFLDWRKFGFDEMKAGHLALWNPHIYGGTQYFGGFQSALLYPPNWLYLCLPLPRAINAGIALHVFLAGWFMYFWVRQRGVHLLASLLAGVLFMFSGAYFLHIFAGHLPNLCTMVWGPLILLAVDGWAARRTPGWLLLGAGALAMQILAGHPQYVFYTGIATGLYCVPLLVRSPYRLRLTMGLAALVLCGVALSAVQLFEGMHTAAESIRSKGTTLSFAGVFSFPFENLLTLITPGFFGDSVMMPYWGRNFIWEMSIFFGVTGFIFAAYALISVRKPDVWILAGVALALVILAFGHYTPVFGFLYRYGPGFNKFRGWSKFIYPATLFLIMLSALGFDAMLRRGRPPRGLVFFTLGSGVILVALAATASWSAHLGSTESPQPWTRWMYAILYSGECLNVGQPYHDPGYIEETAKFSAHSIYITAFTLLALGLVLLGSLRRGSLLVLVPVVATAEMLFFATSTLMSFHYVDPQGSSVAKYLRTRPPGDYRVLNLEEPNEGMSTGADDLWGYDPGVLRRYAEFINATQLVSPDDASQELRFHRTPRIYAQLFRCAYAFDVAQFGSEKVAANEREMNALTYPPEEVSPHVMIVGQTRVLTGRDEIFKAMFPPFDPRKTVLLESVPQPPPAEDPAPGSAKVVAETTDALTIEADVPDASILVVTDTYSDGWKARSLLPAGQGAGQTEYHVMPADYCLRAIPLRAGHHRILLEYRPAAFVAGAWLSAITLALYVAACGWLWAAGRRAVRSPFED